MVKRVAGSEPSLDISSYGLPHHTVRQLYLQLIEYIYDLIAPSTPPSTRLRQHLWLPGEYAWFLGSTLYSGGVESSSTAISRLPLWLSAPEIHADLAICECRSATPQDNVGGVSHIQIKIAAFHVPCSTCQPPRHRPARDESIFET